VHKKWKRQHQRTRPRANLAKQPSKSVQSVIQSYLVKNMRKTTFIAIILLTISQLKAQSIEELLQIAADKNLSLIALDEQYYAARERGAQVNQLPDPTVSVGVFALPIETRLGVQRVRFGAMQTFPNKQLLIAKESALNYQANASGQKRAIKQLDLNFQIKKAYYQLYQLEKSKVILQRNIRIFEAMNQLTLTQVESGKGSAADVLKVNLKLQELKQQLTILEHQKQGPASTINQLLDRDLATEISVLDSLELAVIPYSMEEIATEIEYTHPIIKMYSFQKEVANQNLRINRLDKKPVISAGIDYVVMDKLENFDFARNGRDVIMPKAAVRIPLYKEKYGAKQREEELKITALATMQAQAKSEFLGLVNQAFIKYEEVKLNLELYREQIRTTEGIINVLETQYSAEGKGFDELLQMQISLVNYDLLILEEVVKSHVAKSEIERYLPYE